MRLGIRIRTTKHDGKSMAVACVGGYERPLIDVYDVATGEVIEGVSCVTVDWPVDGVLQATVKLYPVEQQGFEPATVWSEDHA